MGSCSRRWVTESSDARTAAVGGVGEKGEWREKNRAEKQVSGGRPRMGAWERTSAWAYARSKTRRRWRGDVAEHNPRKFGRRRGGQRREGRQGRGQNDNTITGQVIVPATR